MAYADGKSAQTGLDGGNTSVGVHTGANYSPAKDYTIVILAGLAVLALLIVARKKG
jgi:hypothetical protein